MKSYKKIENIVRGFSNHRRIQILELLEKTPELSVAEITEKLKINYNTASDHIRRLSIAGLVAKRNSDRDVRHKLTDRGRAILTFCKTLE
ncbi:hypothetical protein COV42_02370 [Candidatus Campbellbacteria bacterium CG11_big_fil_rev_8_21_14_0_20_44_21]|uniref:HTH arsR-type domain-containing protein n=1 Tax=Candidatus Campbellbacteria bacterium CG22_combo_CG10-13_8_21_14_all_43_18 TaxID=1974530 RepID=A0A2H0DWL8_9BACT|nr:MAG: hypothetical protein COW82_01455 [Candidatus Campbellbacteria bacterium CG22_combo_CG10-13_8_21_14_all_43_18]PIR24143.1 MAG: hypothetical protein COV42_02370 [Candidatus Campbellbacteria bacterium CG11_big_fil_rev_8_21_14_0_20_44_21]